MITEGMPVRCPFDDFGPGAVQFKIALARGTFVKVAWLKIPERWHRVYCFGDNYEYVSVYSSGVRAGELVLLNRFERQPVV